MDIKTVYAETKAVFQILLNSSFLNSCDNFREKLVALSDVTSDFFFVCELLYENQRLAGSQKYSFQHCVMSNAIIVTMHFSETLSLDELDKHAVLARYAEDWESSQNQ